MDKITAPTTKRDARKKEYLNRIIRSAQDIFAEKGFQTTSVDEIAKRAGVTKRTLYSYFPSKLDLYSRMYDDYQNELQMMFAGTLKLNLPSDQLVFRHLDDLFKFTKRHEKFMRFHMWILDSDEFMGEIPYELKRRVFARSNAMLSAATGHLSRALEDGRLIDVDPHVLVESMVALIKGIYMHASNDRRFKSPRINPKKCYDLFRLILQRGLVRSPRDDTR